MEKIITISNKDVKLSNSVAWTMEYRDQFGKDIVPTLMPILVSASDALAMIISEAGEDINTKSIAEALNGRSMEVLLPLFQVEFVDLVIDVVWAMAKAADEGIAPPKQWVRQFDEFPLDEIVPALLEMIVKGFVSSKNLKRLKSVGASLKNLQPSHSMTSSSQDSSED